MIKASDFRLVYPDVTHIDPVYRQSRGDLNRPIRGFNVEALKFRPSMCKQCNNARTQPHDRAWEALLKFVHSAKPKLRRGDRLPFGKIFPAHLQQSLNSLQLYFVKQLGCHAVENRINLPLAQFGACILTNNPHPGVRLIFVAVDPRSSKAEIQVGDIKALETKDKILSAVWHYRVRELGVIVHYHIFERDDSAWHPEDAKNPRLMDHPRLL